MMTHRELWNNVGGFKEDFPRRRAGELFSAGQICFPFPIAGLSAPCLMEINEEWKIESLTEMDLLYQWDFSLMHLIFDDKPDLNPFSRNYWSAGTTADRVFHYNRHCSGGA